MKDKLPYEYLLSGDGFEEVAILYDGSTSKFNIICTWEDKDGNKYENTVLTSI